MTDREKLLVTHQLMQQEFVPYLGREHLLACGEAWEFQKLASATFEMLTARKMFPNDARKPDFEALGLVITTRAGVGLGQIPEFARIHPMARSNSPTYKTEIYAIKTQSLGDLVHSFNRGEMNPPPRFSMRMVQFLGDVTFEAMHLQKNT